MLSVKHTLNYHVVHIYLHGLPNEGYKELVHQPLVGGPCILEPEGITLQQRRPWSVINAIFS